MIWIKTDLRLFSLAFRLVVATISEKVLASSEKARSGCCSSIEVESDGLDLPILDGLLPVALVGLDNFSVDLDMLVVVGAAFDATFFSLLLFIAAEEAVLGSFGAKKESSFPCLPGDGLFVLLLPFFLVGVIRLFFFGGCDDAEAFVLTSSVSLVIPTTFVAAFLEALAFVAFVD